MSPFHELPRLSDTALQVKDMHGRTHVRVQNVCEEDDVQRRPGPREALQTVDVHDEAVRVVPEVVVVALEQGQERVHFAVGNGLQNVAIRVGPADKTAKKRGLGRSRDRPSGMGAYPVRGGARAAAQPLSPPPGHCLPFPGGGMAARARRPDPPPPCVTFRRVAVSPRGPGQSPVPPSVCCVGALRFVGSCGLCSCWCRFRVRGAP